MLVMKEVDTMQNFDSLDYELSEKLLTKDISEIQSADLPANCVNAMVEMHLPIVKQVVNTFQSAAQQNIAYDDMVAAGVIGLINAMDEYDPYADIEFSVFCISYIQETVIDIIRYSAWLKNNRD